MVRTTNYGIRLFSFQGAKVWISFSEKNKTAKYSIELKNLVKT